MINNIQNLQYKSNSKQLELQYIPFENEDVNNQNTNELKDLNPWYAKWLVLIGFSVITFTNASGFTQFSSILQNVQQYYEVDQSSVLNFFNIYYYTYILLSLPGLYLWQWRMDGCLIIASTFNTVGQIMQFLAQDNFQIALLGQFITALGQVSILGGNAIISEYWFDKEDQLLALSIGYFSNVLGLSFGFLSGAYIVSEPQDMEYFNKFNAIIFIISWIISVAFIRNNKYTQNLDIKTQNNSKKPKQLGITESIIKCFSNLSNLMLIISLSVYLGLSWTFQDILDVILSNYSMLEIGYLGLLMNLMGTVAGLASSIHIEHQMQKGQIPSYPQLITIFSSISIFFVILLTVYLKFDPQGDNKIFIFIVTGIIGMGFQGFIPIGAESMIQIVHPVEDYISFTVFNQIACILGLLGNFITQQGMWLLCVCLFPLYIYLIFVYNKDSFIKQNKEI